VRLPDARRGFIQIGDIIAGELPKLNADETVGFAKQFLGLPYTWGGTSTFGYDCSGFMQMLMRQRRYGLPRDSGPQSRWEGLMAVDASDLRPGDLLYFGASEQRITHTGMYIGDGQFISATAHERPMVRIDRLDDPHWAKSFVGARRVRP
jgi:cell wall-associated NlpC family hydrolase